MHKAKSRFYYLYNYLYNSIWYVMNFGVNIELFIYITKR